MAAKEQLQFRVGRGSEAVHDLCRRIISERGWSVDELSATNITARTGPPGTAWKWAPLTIRISLQEAGSETLLSLDAVWPGKVGPYARKQVMKKLVAFRESLEFEVGREH